jgi:hypothetical protein
MQRNHLYGKNISSSEQRTNNNNNNATISPNWTLSTTLTARYYLCIVLVAIPVLSWNWSMHHLWTEMSAMEEYFLLLDYQTNTRRNSLLLFDDSANGGLIKVNKDRGVLEDENKEDAAAALVDIQYTELPSGLTTTVKRPRLPRQTSATTLTPKNNQDRSQINNNDKNNQNNTTHANPTGVTVKPTSTTMATPLPPTHNTNNGKIRIRVTPQGHIDIKDPSDPDDTDR